MREKIYISVVLSTFNEELYIYDSIKSILDQTYPYFEFIIVNDGSTDGTLNVIKKFKDDRIVIINKDNTGLPDSLNVGIKHAKYDWIARMDGDDIALPNRLEEQVKLINSGVAVIGGQFFVINEKSEYISNRLSNNPLNSFLSKFYLFMGWTPLAHPTALINKKALLSCGGYDPNFVASQDMDLWFRIGKRNKIVNLSTPVLLYRMHNNNISHSKKDRQVDLAFLAFVKRALGFNRVLSRKEFNDLYENKLTGQLLVKNRTYVKKMNTLGTLLKWIVLLRYYFWRFYVYLKLLTISKKQNKTYM